MKILILAPSLSHNNAARTFMLQQVLSRGYRTVVAGPVFGGGIWAPLSKEDWGECYQISTRAGWRSLFSFWPLLRLSIKLKPDYVYISKPLYPVMLIGVLLKLRGVKLVVDIDDYELGGWWRLSLPNKVLSLLRITRAEVYFPLTVLSYGLIRQADAITVASRFLQRKYGGTIIVHARDTEAISPKQFPASEGKKALGLEGKKVVMFLGSIRPHKGVDVLLRACREIDAPRLRVVIGAAPKHDAYVRHIMKLADERVTFLPSYDFREMPMLLSAADVVALPQRYDSYTQAQMPAKLYEAMALGKAVVASNLSDFPTVLREGAGILVEPNDVQGLREKLTFLLEHTEERETIGARARKRVVEEFSYSATERVFRRIFK